ncbi:DUF1858 domain-containing protein [Cesiribacter andamanensis]|uniref:DUF1858 domain-containing protein n=1 Tax=Cesiribacter andamanensis AMV16 TaxID=1279009 RepID=M7NKS2_9BACT|nr:DUF1858 domain-containing protein [Cesiribacter andamanensis]EMR02385.1 hypothetical protein ADICEAN_02481 [Cesiribacter andamanensis AMV16]
MLVNEHTKIAALLKHHPQALENLVSLTPAFEKLRNPLLRKLMAGRTSIGMAARVGGCRPADIFRALKPLGFRLEPEGGMQPASRPPMPAFLEQLPPEQLHSLDVRPLLAGGTDPLKEILTSLKVLPKGLCLRSSTPLSQSRSLAC